jgi:hypothetical protein
MRQTTLLGKLGFQDADHKTKKHDAGAHFFAEKETLCRICDMFELWPKLYWGETRHFKYDLTRISLQPPTEVTREIVDIELRTEVPLSKGEHQYKTTIGFIDGVVKFRCCVSGKVFPWKRVHLFVTEKQHQECQMNECKDFPQTLCEKCTQWKDMPIRVIFADGKIPAEYYGCTDFRMSNEDSTLMQYTDKNGEQQTSYTKNINGSKAITLTDSYVPCMLVLDFHTRYVSALQEQPSQQREVDAFYTIHIETKCHPVPASDIVRQINLYREYMSGGLWAWTSSNFRWFALTCFDLSETEQADLKCSNITWVRLGALFDAWYDSKQEHPPKKARCEL